MNTDQAYEKLSEYLDGGLSPGERSEIQQLLRSDAGLAAAFRVSQDIEMALRGEVWVEPSSDFTRRILKKAGLRRAVRTPTWARTWEPAKIWVSLVMLVILGSWHGKTLFASAAAFLGRAGLWLDGLMGIALFSVHPAVILAFLAPLAAAGFAACVLIGRCRISSQ